MSAREYAKLHLRHAAVAFQEFPSAATALLLHAAIRAAWGVA